MIWRSQIAAIEYAQKSAHQPVVYHIIYHTIPYCTMYIHYKPRLFSGSVFTIVYHTIYHPIPCTLSYISVAWKPTCPREQQAKTRWCICAHHTCTCAPGPPQTYQDDKCKIFQDDQCRYDQDDQCKNYQDSQCKVLQIVGQCKRDETVSLQKKEIWEINQTPVALALSQAGRPGVATL